MASVAICPHCYLQLVVPDGVEPGERVECPTCAKEFGLDQAVLRPIPEVVRRSAAAMPPPTVDAPEVVVEVAEEVEIEAVEIEEKFLSAPEPLERESDSEAARYIEEIKARIESEIAAGGLTPGANTFLSLDEPELSLELNEPAAEETDDPLSAFRNAKTVAEVPVPDDAVDRQEEISFDLEVDEPISAIGDAGNATDDLASEPFESRATQPTVRTLADWMQPREDTPEEESLPEALAAEIEAAGEEQVDELVEEAEAGLGPSFDLPNVPLVPNNGATIEFDPDMSFGPAAETEFELDDVNFESTEAEETIANELSDDVAEESEPVFPESKSEMPAAPFILPGVPRARKKRSVVRVLAGTALGALVGLSLGYFVLLYVLGPEGDLLRIAKYIPSAVLPKSFHAASPIARADLPSASAPANDAAPAHVASDDATVSQVESENIPAGYVEETTASAPVASDDASSDDRYDTEPAPLDEPAAEPIEHESRIAIATPLPLQGPTFTVNQLAEALEAGEAAQAGLVNGDLSDSAVRRIKGASYEKLGELAEALTFVDASSPSIESEDATTGAVQLFHKLLSNPHTRNEIARIVTIWIPSTHRENSGIFFAGTPSGGEIAGDVYEYQVSTEAGSRLTLLSHEPLESSLADSGRPIGVVGAIVDRPAENVQGYQGTAERAIWLTQAIPLD